MTIEPVRLDIRDTIYPGHGVMFDVWGLYPNGDMDLCRQCGTRAEAERYVAARYQPARLEITRHRFSTTQGEATLTYAGAYWDRFGDNVQMREGGEFSGLSDDEWHAVARRLFAERNAKAPHVQTYDRLHLVALNPEQHQTTCGYWYTVTHASTAHTAFARRDSLLQWAVERGLTIEGDVPSPGTHASITVAGAYRTALHLSPLKFWSLQGVESCAMSNGQYTLAIITTDDDGLRTVHTLNPNVKTRPVYDRAECTAFA